MLAEAAYNAGVITDEEYAAFQNAGYMGLYGGLDVSGIHKNKRLKPGDKILDFMGQHRTYSKFVQDISNRRKT